VAAPEPSPPVTSSQQSWGATTVTRKAAPSRFRSTRAPPHRRRAAVQTSTPAYHGFLDQQPRDYAPRCDRAGDLPVLSSQHIAPGQLLEYSLDPHRGGGEQREGAAEQKRIVTVAWRYSRMIKRKNAKQAAGTFWTFSKRVYYPLEFSNHCLSSFSYFLSLQESNRVAECQEQCIS